MYWRYSSGKCHCPLRTNQFTHIHDLIIFNQSQHNYNHDKNSKEDCFPRVEDQKFTADEFINENIHIDCYDRYNSDTDRRSFNSETENIASNLNLNDGVKMDLYCKYTTNIFNKYIKCIKEIVPPFVSTVLKNLIKH